MLKKIFYWPILNWIRFWAVLKLKIDRPFIIGVTGSVGKSTCVYLLDKILSSKYKVKTTFHGNSETGLPLEILNLRYLLDSNSPLTWPLIVLLSPFQILSKNNYHYLVAEMGVDEPGEPKNMSYLLKILKPNIGIFLSVAPIHTQQFLEVIDPKKGDLKEQALEMIAKEKGLLVTELDKNGTAIINGDSPFIKALIPKINANLIKVGIGSGDFNLVDHQVSTKGCEFEFVNDESKYQINIEGKLLHQEFGYTLLSCIAAAEVVGLSINESVSAIEQGFEMPPGRQTLIEGKKGSTILDSSYNNSPDALEAFLKMLNKIKVKGKKIAILGDMRELGSIAEDEHKRLVKMAKDYLDIVVTVGPLMRDYFVPELLNSGFPKEDVHSFLISQGVGDFVAKELLEKDDFILVKGSQNTIYLEEAVKELMAKPEVAAKLLCRQFPSWDKVREKFFKENSN